MQTQSQDLPAKLFKPSKNLVILSKRIERFRFRFNIDTSIRQELGFKFKNAWIGFSQLLKFIHNNNQ